MNTLEQLRDLIHKPGLYKARELCRVLSLWDGSDEKIVVDLIEEASGVPLDAVLCYASNHSLWFTTQKLEDQWGDDWRNVPYEHNAEPPYYYHRMDKERGDAPWSLVQMWLGPHSMWPPYEGLMNSLYSVQEINQGDCPWLRDMGFSEEKGSYIKRQLMAGATVLEAFRFVLAASCEVLHLELDP